ncbi:MAG: porphobilinogen synthase [Vicinamibacterales bacterium]
MSGHPTRRLRRLRRSSTMRSLVRETRLSVDDLVQPLFIVEDPTSAGPVSSMPGVDRLSLQMLDREIDRLVESGIKALLLFGTPAVKDATGSAASRPDSIVARSLRRIRQRNPSLLLIVDVCLCSYTTHGHCGIVANGEVHNDATIARLAETAVSFADAGADVVAPSAMMDGQVAAIRRALDASGHEETAILSYAVKFASAFYGPFREAADSAPQFGNRRGYQLDPVSVRQALEEARLDVEEGADMVMVKPALPYLDILARVRAAVDVPLFSYQVSGEYSLIKAAAMRGWIDEDAAVDESLIAIKRAGADVVITYFATSVGKRLSQPAETAALTGELHGRS